MLACGAALLLTSPYTPMLFMGEEWGASTPWQYFTDHTDPELAEAVRQGRGTSSPRTAGTATTCPTRRRPRRSSTRGWTGPSRRRGRTRGCCGWYRELIALRRDLPELHDGRLDLVQPHHDHERGLLLVVRGEHRVVVNLSDEPRTAPADGRVLLSWEPGVTAAGGAVEVPPQSAVIVGP